MPHPLCSLILLLAVGSCVIEGITYNLNIAAYDESSCHTSPCAAFQNSSLWIPEGIPGGNDTVLINAIEPVTLNIPINTAVSLFKISLLGNVSLVVEGRLTFPTTATNYSLVVCDYSDVKVSGNGYLFSHSTGYFDESVLTVLDQATVILDHVNITGASIYFELSGGTSTMGEVLGVVEDLIISNHAKLVILGSSAMVHTLEISGSPSVGYVQVTSSAVLTGDNIQMGELELGGDATASIYGCPNISFIFTRDNAVVNITSDTCNLNSVAMSDSSTIRLRGDTSFSIAKLYVNQAGSKPQIATLAFVQIAQVPGAMTYVNLPSNLSPTYLAFDGIFNVSVGALGQFPLIGALNLGKIVVTGFVSLYSVQSVISNTYKFAFVPGLEILIPSYGTLQIQNYTFTKNDFAQLRWLPGGTIYLGDSAQLRDETLEISQNRKIIINGFGSDPSLVLSNLNVSSGSALEITRTTSILANNTDIYGVLDVGGWTNATIYGPVKIARTGVVHLPQTIGTPISATISHTFLQVVGEFTLSGILNITLDGLLPDGTTYKDYNQTIVVLNATKVIGDFDTFSYTINGLLSQDLKVSYKIMDNSVVVHVGGSSKERNKGDGRTKWYILGGGLAALFVVAIGIIFVGCRRKRAQYENF